MVKHQSSDTGPIYHSGCHKILTSNVPVYNTRYKDQFFHAFLFRKESTPGPVAPLYIVYCPKYRLYNPIKVLFRNSVFVNRGSRNGSQ